MPGKQAKIVSPLMLTRMLQRASKSPLHARDRAVILLSVKAGLRACEIARLDWSMVLDGRGKVADALAIHDAIAKKHGGRRVPTHPDLRGALQSLLRTSDQSGPVIRSAKGGHMRATSIINWFASVYRELGFEGCSSHSGRRTFITNAARNVHRAGCSLRDVQLLAGHASIETTQRYIDGDTSGQRRLVSLL
jgi:integrase